MKTRYTLILLDITRVNTADMDFIRHSVTSVTSHITNKNRHIPDSIRAIRNNCNNLNSLVHTEQMSPDRIILSSDGG